MAAEHGFHRHQPHGRGVRPPYPFALNSEGLLHSTVRAFAANGRSLTQCLAEVRYPEDNTMCSKVSNASSSRVPAGKRVIQQDIGDGFVEVGAPQRPETEPCIGRFDHVPQRLGVGDPVGYQLNHAHDVQARCERKRPQRCPGAAYCQHHRLVVGAHHRRVARRSRRSGSSDPLPPGRSFLHTPKRRSRSAYPGMRPTGRAGRSRETASPGTPFRRYADRQQQEVGRSAAPRTAAGTVDIRHVGLCRDILRTMPR